MKKTRRQSGDTLVEVLLATVILSAVLAAAYTLTNRATQINQESFERTQVSNYVQAQLEYIRAARDRYVATDLSASQAWNNIIDKAATQVPLGSDCDDLSTLDSNRANAFYVENDGETATDGIQTLDSIFRVWVEISPGLAGSDTYDVIAYGCWEALGDNPTNRAASILRLKDPS